MFQVINFQRLSSMNIRKNKDSSIRGSQTSLDNIPRVQEGVYVVEEHENHDFSNQICCDLSGSHILRNIR